MAQGQRGVSAQRLPLIQSIAGLEIPVWHEGGSSISTVYGAARDKCAEAYCSPLHPFHELHKHAAVFKAKKLNK